MITGLKIIPFDLLPAYKQQVRHDLEATFNNLKDADISTDTFSFYTSVAAVFMQTITYLYYYKQTQRL